jgi:hypothetical protein
VAHCGEWIGTEVEEGTVSPRREYMGETHVIQIFIIVEAKDSGQAISRLQFFQNGINEGYVSCDDKNFLRHNFNLLNIQGKGFISVSATEPIEA